MTVLLLAESRDTGYGPLLSLALGDPQPSLPLLRGSWRSHVLMLSMWMEDSTSVNVTFTVCGLWTPSGLSR